MDYALSIQQPWAYLIIHRYKTIENRTWSTTFRGRIFIHAPKSFDWEGYHYLLKNTSIRLPGPSSFQKGGIVGYAYLTDCVTQSRNKFFSGPYGFVLQKAKPLPFMPCPGSLSFFKVIYVPIGRKSRKLL